LAGATAAATPPVQLPPPVSDQGVTSYGTYSRTVGGGGKAAVNVMSGLLNLDPVDLAISGRGVSLILERYYNSGDTKAGFFGLGWTSLLDARIDYCDGGDLKYRSPSGAIYPIQVGLGNSSRIQGLHATHDTSGRIIFDNGIIFTFGTGIRCNASSDWQYLYYLSSISDRNGNTIIIKRDASGVPTQIVDSLNRTVTITSTFGRITKISPAGGLASIVYTYPSGQLTTVTRGDERPTIYRYTTYSYDRPTSLLSGIQDPSGYLTTFTYELSTACKNRIHDIFYATQDPDKGDRYVYETCTNGVPNYGHTSSRDPNYNVTTYTWDPTNDPGPTTITDARGRVTELKYGDYNFDISTIKKISTANNNEAVRTKTWVYDNTSFLGNDVDGTVQEFHDTFDDQDIVSRYYYTDDRPPCSDSQTRTSPPTLLDLTCHLNRFLPTYVVNPEGVGIVFGYDEKGNLEGAQVGADLVLTPHNSDGTLKAIKRPRGETHFAYEYDGSKNLTKVTVTDPLGRSSETTYDSVGRPKETTSAARKQTTFRFDSLSRLRRVTYEDGRVELGYDTNSNLAWTDDTRTGLFLWL
jgi:YD repeat-containing protein